MNYIKERTLKIADYFLENKTTVREAAKVFGVSKSTVHSDLTKRLKIFDLNKHRRVKLILELHFNIKHINGGNATKKKHKGI